jgi:hypothetical protein
MAEVLTWVGGILVLVGFVGVSTSVRMQLTMKYRAPRMEAWFRQTRKPCAVMLAFGACLLLLSLL